MRVVLIALVAVLLLSVLPSPTAATSFTVTATNFVWTPSSLTIYTGDSVTFTNGGGTHWLQSLSSGFSSCNPLPCTKTFTSAASYSYRCGVHASMTGTLVVKIKPTVAFTAPAPSEVVRATISVTGTASHPTENVTSVKLKVDGGPLLTTTLSPSAGKNVNWSYTLDTTPYSEGVHTLTATATTASGITETATRTIDVENLLVAITSPTDGATVAGFISVIGTASHPTSAISSVKVSVDGGTLTDGNIDMPGTDASWSYDIDTPTLTNAVHSLTAQATSANGRVKSATITFNVVNPVTRDLAAGALSATFPLLGNPVLSVPVSNPGNTASGAYSVLWEYKENGTWKPIATTSAASLAAHGSTTLSLTWNTGTHVGKYDVRATLDSDGVIDETDESNNVAKGTANWYTGSVPGDDPLNDVP